MKTAKTMTTSHIIAIALIGIMTSCSQGEFASGGGQPADAKKNPKSKGGVDSEDPSNPLSGGKVDPNAPVIPTNGTTPNPNNTLVVDNGGLLVLTDVYNGAVSYQGNQCPGGGACGEEYKQVAIDGLDFRNLSSTSSLQPSSVAAIAAKYVGKTVLTGLGSGALWGGRSVKFKASSVAIYNGADVIVANACPADRVPMGKPKVAHTSEMGQFLCAKLDPRISLGANVTVAQSGWNYGVTGECPAGHIVTGANFGGVIGGPWSIICAPMKVK